MCRHGVALTLFLLASAAASAEPKVGERTTSPNEMVAEVGIGNSDEEMTQAIAAAAVYPLGTLGNPIRVAGPEGERAYLSRLRCAEGSSPRIGARNEAGVGIYGSVVAAYELACGSEATRLIFDMYQQENVETRAPIGFAIVP